MIIISHISHIDFGENANMRLFHQLDQSDQHNAIHYCMQLAIDDMLELGVQIEPATDSDKEMCSILEKTIKDAKALPVEKQFEFVASHEDAGQYIFDISLDMARGAYYHSDDEVVIHYESLRCAHEDDSIDVDMDDDGIEKVEDLLIDTKPKNKHYLN